MSTAGSSKTLREGSLAKRTAILVAARDLFLRQGVDRVSMDAVAAGAGVSKRTVYDYFGDKRGLFTTILAEASASMDTSARRALAEHLGDPAAVTTLAQLEKALTAVAIDLGTSIVGSPDYAAAFTLVAQQRLQTQTIEDDVVTTPIEDALTACIVHFTEAGLLETDNPARATDHFGALTVLLAYNQHPVPALADADQIRQIMIDGVSAFIRAYARR